MAEPEVILRGGHVIDADRAESIPADVHIEGGQIAAVVEPSTAWSDAARETIDCAGRLIMPGFVDAHSHADAAVLDPGVQLALLRDGVTTIVAGQDGVSFAPGDGRYASEYFRAINGEHPTYAGGGVTELLATYDGSTRVNVAYLVPHGTVRHAVLGLADRAAEPAELAAMTAAIEAGLAAGAVGLSSGLDYVPGRIASADELAALSIPVAEAGGVYVTHMRGGYEHNSAAGIEEVIEIGRRSGARAHVSHYHGPGTVLRDLLDDATAGGVDITFDAYPYRAGCTLLTMPILPSELLARGTEATLAALADNDARRHLVRDHLPAVARVPYLGAGWPQRMTLAHVDAAEYAWSVGLTLQVAADRSGRSVEEFILDLLLASRLHVSVIMPLPPGRTVEQLATLIRHPNHMVGTDGIYRPGHPHPRGWGTFGRILARHVRARHDLTWSQAARHLSRSAVERFGLGRRGAVRTGYVADLVVVDPAAVADQATYDSPSTPTTGIDDVLVAGRPVLRNGALTTNLAGRGLRHAR